MNNEKELRNRDRFIHLGIAIAALLAIRDEEQRKEEEAAMQEELYDEQESIWQLSM